MFKLVVLISGSGSNLQSLIDSVHSGSLPARITTVIADRSAKGLERAAASDIKTCLIDRKKWGIELSKKINENIPQDTDLIVLAGFLSILSNDFISQWRGKVINIHPSLLPDFGGKGMYGLRVHQAVIESGRKKSGCSVHFVDSGVDTGEVIMQKAVPVLEGDSPEILQKRILDQEHQLLVRAVAGIIENHKLPEQGRK